MISKERLDKIDELICQWNQAQREKEEYPTTDDELGSCEAMQYHEDAASKEIVDRAAREMNIPVDELLEYFKHDPYRFG